MSREDIIKKLDEIFANNKAKSFLNHLIRSYVPNNNVDKIFIKPKGDFKCVLTNDKLISVNEILEGVTTDEFKDDVFRYLHVMLSPEEKASTPIQNLMKGKDIAIQGENTDTFMSLETYKVFYDWVITKLLSGDKHISWLMGNIDRSQFTNSVKGINNPTTQKAINKQDKKDMDNRATYSLGDMSVLQALKAKMEGK